jgi:hypothetical protein
MQYIKNTFVSNTSGKKHYITVKVDSAPLMKGANNPDIEIIDAENYEIITPSNNDKIKIT